MWQAGLLCLVVTVQAVVVHQSPIYAIASNKLQPQTVYKTTLNPQTIYSPPKDTLSYFQQLPSHTRQLLSHPQQLLSHPQQLLSHPQQLLSHPQQLLSHPQQLLSHPQQLLSHPQQLLSHPQQLLSHPQQLLNHPKQLLSHPKPLANHLQPSIPSNHEEDYYDEPSYSFTYQIQDDLTGDQKSHSETRQGDVVQGSYSLIEPDGSRRIVDYTADKIRGFRALVRREKGAAKPIAAAKAPVAVYQPAHPAVQTYVPQYAPTPKYQNGPVTFRPAKYLYSQLQPAPVTESTKSTPVTIKPPAAYNPVVYASPLAEDKIRTAPGSFTNPNQISYNPVQYA